MMLKYALSSAFLVATRAFVVAPRRARGVPSHLFLLDNLFSNQPKGQNSNNGNNHYPIYADESVMNPKAHGTSATPVQQNLRWNCDYASADRICNFNRHYAEHAGYWQTTDFLKTYKNEEQPIKFYDSNTGELLFTAPVGRSMEGTTLVLTLVALRFAEVLFPIQY